MFESLNDLLAWKAPHQQEIISHGILPVGAKLVLAGEEETLKTMFSTFAGFNISLGLPLLGYKTTKSRVGMLQAELPKAMFRERIEQLVNLSKNGLKKSDIQFATVLDMKLNKQAGAAVLTSAVKQLQLNLLIIDPLYKVLSGNVSDWDEMSKLCDNLDNICRTLNCSIWLVHHRRKSQLQDGHVVDLGTDELIGSSQLKDWMDTCLRLDWYNKSADLLKLTFSKCRNSRTRLHPTIVRFNRQDLTFSAVEDIDISADQLKD